MTIDELAAKIDAQFEDVRNRIEDLELKLDERFNSNTRDEARDALREEMHRRFDAEDRKHHEQFTLLRAAVHHLKSQR